MDMAVQTESVDATISRTVRALVAYRGGNARAQVMAALGINRSAYYNRLAGETARSAADVKRAADALGVSVATLYDGLVAGAGFEPATSGQRRSRTVRGDELALAA